MNALALMRALGEVSIGLFAVFVLIALASWYGVLRVALGVLVAIVLFASWNRSDAATVVFNGRTCSLPDGVNIWTQPLRLPVCGGNFECRPMSTAYLATATLVVQAACFDVSDRVFAGSFEEPIAVAVEPVTHAKGAWQSLSPNSSSAAGNTAPAARSVVP